MPLYKKEVTEESIWGIWKIEETPSELLEALQSKEEIAPQLKQYNTVKRQTEFLALRVLLQELGRCCSGRIRTIRSSLPGLISLFISPYTYPRLSAVYMLVRLGGYRHGITFFTHIPKCVVFRRKSRRSNLSRGEKHCSFYWSAKETLFKAINEKRPILRHLHIRPFKVQPEGVIEAYETRTLSITV